MSLNSLKYNLLNEIKSLRSLNANLFDFSQNNSFGASNNLNNPLDFLLELLKSLVGLEDLRRQVTNFLTYRTNTIETTIKNALKLFLKKKYSCGIDDIVPEELINTYGAGFNISVKQIDFFGLLKTDPTSVEGKVLYGSTNRDLNVFLYEVLQGNTGNWKDIIVVEYLPVGIVDGDMRSNVLNVKIHESWYNRSVNDFINQFIDSISLYSVATLLNQTVNLIFSPITARLNLSSNEIENQAIIRILVDRIINLPETEVDNSYYEFNNIDSQIINNLVEQISNGFTFIRSCEYTFSSVEFSTLEDFNLSFDLASTEIEIKNIIDNTFEVLIQEATEGFEEGDAIVGGANVIISFFKGIILALVNTLISPKLMFLFVTYFKIVNLSVGFKNFRDFFNENLSFFVEIIRDVILPIFVDFLFDLVTKVLKDIVIEDQLERKKEMARFSKISILSLLGVPTEILNTRIL